MKATHDELTAGEQLAHANKIDRACDKFESSWKHGHRPRIAAFLEQSDQSVQSTLLIELVKLDLYYRTAAGETPDLHEYTSQFPQFADELSQLVDGTGTGISLTQTWHLPRAKERVAHYELREHVGQGAFSSVWRAWDTKLERTVAVKLPGAKLMEPLLLDMFLHEARAAAQLDHPHIVPVHDFGEHGEGGYIVFALVPGIDLKRWLKLRKPTPREAAAICAKLADALDHAHRFRVVHRDLKPANVIMDGDDQPHITDFGLAKRVDIDSTIAIPGEPVGTIPYMSPEQARGEANVDAQSDLYSLGVILYEMLSGETPFLGDRRQVAYQIENDEAKPLRTRNKAIPRDLETICLKCLAKQKPDRYPTTAALRDDLERFLKGEPIRARRISPAGRAWRWVRRNTLVATALGIGGCALLSAGGMMAYTLTAPPLPEPGERMVTLTTDPQDAKVAFVPLDELTGEPLPEQIIHCQERTPLHQSLPPGNYLVVAYLDDDSGRFHEVYRRVPEFGETAFGHFRHQRWYPLNDGTFELPKIAIPKTTIVEGMAFVEGADRFQVGIPGSTEAPFMVCRVPAFYLDPKEFTVRQFREYVNGTTPVDNRWKKHAAPDDWALTISFDEAMTLAECAGKRLLHESEYEFAATAGGTRPISWSAESQSQAALERFGPVGVPDVDSLTFGSVTVFGLCSNVAEWTQCGKLLNTPDDQFVAPRFTSLEYQIVRGGNSETVKGTPAVTEDSRDPRCRIALPRYELKPGLGFRCARSAKPRLLAIDFVQQVD